MSILQVLTAPDPHLRKISSPVISVDNDIRKLMDDMLKTMYKDRGIGLAANQVGVLKRVLVLDLQDEDELERASDFYPLYVANPKIIETSDEFIEAEEGCLSVPDHKIYVARPERIKVSFLDYHNKKQEIETGGWLARAFQHEIDHLDGKLLIDYLSKLKKDIVLRKLTKLKRKI